MIRLPLSSIILGPSDLKEFEGRQNRLEALKALEDEQGQSSRYGAGAQDEPNNEFLRQFATCYAEQHQTLTKQEMKPPTPNGVTINSLYGLRTPSSPVLSTKTNGEEDYTSISLSSSPQSLIAELPRPPSPPKDEFHYGGFIEHPGHSRTSFQPSANGMPLLMTTRSNSPK